eukprot:TRINITY_DN2202_c1_g3_i1.p1 TRINITY_DN2202_c1_g3~~TRINITY_DN2202_c1_g3_i1.p1  ORF type:complete len:519 (+),score=119.68 TRINITY_DN2202_c1_g3_i1:71-1558(+)
MAPSAVESEAIVSQDGDVMEPLVNSHPPSTRPVWTTFLLFSVVFSLNHGTVTASIPLATGDFGNSLGSYSLGTLYAWYTAAAMLLAVPMLDRIGAKQTLVVGLGCNAVYVASYLVGRHTTGAVRWFAVLFGAVIGGVAAGLIWPAQGLIFARCSEWYAVVRDVDTRQATSLLGGVFAALYLAIEVFCKVLSSVTQVWVCGDDWHGDFVTGHCGDGSSSSGAAAAPEDSGSSGSGASDGRGVVIGMYIVIASAMTLLMIAVPLAGAETVGNASQSDSSQSRAWMERARAAFQLMLNDPKVSLMAGVNVAFGLSVSFVNSYVTGTVVKESLGASKVGYLDAIIPLVAAVLSMPLARMSQVFGTKTPAMLFGAACFTGVSAAFTFTSDPIGSLGTWSVLPAMFVLFGAGRAVWEGPAKAVFADFFLDDAQAGFSNLILQFGASAAAAFYLFPSMDRVDKGAICTAVSAWSGAGYLIADRMYRRDRSRRRKELAVQTDL